MAADWGRREGGAGEEGKGGGGGERRYNSHKYVLYINKVFLNWQCTCINVVQFTALTGEVNEENQLQTAALFWDLHSITEFQPPQAYNHVTMTAALFTQNGGHITRTTGPVLTYHYLCSLIRLVARELLTDIAEYRGSEVQAEEEGEWRGRGGGDEIRMGGGKRREGRSPT